MKYRDALSINQILMDLESVLAAESLAYQSLAIGKCYSDNNQHLGLIQEQVVQLFSIRQACPCNHMVLNILRKSRHTRQTSQNQ